MKIQGQHRFQAPREEVWEALLDPEVLSRTVPGSTGLVLEGDHTYIGKLKMKVGPVQGVFDGKVQLSDLKPPSAYKIEISGQGPPGFVNGSGAITLEDAGSETILSYDVDVQVGGRIAGVGQRLIESSSKVITRQALEALDAQIAARVSAAGSPADRASADAAQADLGDGEPTEVSEVPPAMPSSARTAVGFAAGLLDELLPEGVGRWLIGGVVVVLIALLLRSCT